MTNAKNGISEMRPQNHRDRRRRRRRQCGQQHDQRKISKASISSSANTDAQALATSKASRLIQLGAACDRRPGRRLAAGNRPGGRRRIDRRDHGPPGGSHMCFVTAGMGGGTGTGAAPVIAQAARKAGILTVGVVTKPFTLRRQAPHADGRCRHRGAARRRPIR